MSCGPLLVGEEEDLKPGLTSLGAFQSSEGQLFLNPPSEAPESQGIQSIASLRTTLRQSCADSVGVEWVGGRKGAQATSPSIPC